MLAGVAAGVLAGAVLLGGCQPTGDVTTPPPISPILPTEQTTPTGSATSSTPSASPSASLVVTARPTTPEETAALAAEAEHVYREMQRLVDEYEGKGGAATLPEPLKAYVGGEYADAVEATLKYTHEQGRRIEGTTLISRIQLLTSGDGVEALISVQFCNDRSRLIHISKDGKRTPLNSRVMNSAQFTRGADGKLRMTDNVAKEAASCGQ